MPAIIHSKAMTRREWNWFWKWSWDSFVHPLFSWHHYVPCGRKYSGSEFHYCPDIDPNPLLQATKTRYSAVFGIDTDIFSWCPCELRSRFPLQGNSILRFPGWSPSFCGISVSLQCPFPPVFLQFCMSLGISHCPSQVHSLRPSFSQPRPWSFSTHLPCIFSTIRSFQMRMKQTLCPRFAWILALQINREKELQEFHVNHKTYFVRNTGFLRDRGKGEPSTSCSPRKVQEAAGMRVQLHCPT